MHSMGRCGTGKSHEEYLRAITSAFDIQTSARGNELARLKSSADVSGTRGLALGRSAGGRIATGRLVRRRRGLVECTFARFDDKLGMWLAYLRTPTEISRRQLLMLRKLIRAGAPGAWNDRERPVPDQPRLSTRREAHPGVWNGGSATAERRSRRRSVLAARVHLKYPTKNCPDNDITVWLCLWRKCVPCKPNTSSHARPLGLPARRWTSAAWNASCERRSNRSPQKSGFSRRRSPSSERRTNPSCPESAPSKKR